LFTETGEIQPSQGGVALAEEPKQRAAKASDDPAVAGSRIIALPFRTFAEIETHGLVVQAWCSGRHTIRRLILEPAYRNRFIPAAD
jgi:hypothetical protein